MFPSYLKSILCFLLLIVSSSGFAQEKKKEDRKKAPLKSKSIERKTDAKPIGFYLKRAVNNDALLEEAKANIDFAKARQYRADWAWGPKVKSTTVFSYVPANADTDEFGNNFDEILDLNLGPYLRQSFQLGIPLYTFGRIRIAKKLARLGVKVAELKADQARDQVLYQTHQAYYGLQLANSLNALLLEGAKLIKKELKKAEEDRDFGESKMKTKDFRKLQIFNAEVDGRILESEKLRAIADAGLRYLTASEKVAVGRLDTKGKIEELKDLDSYIASANLNRPEVEMLKRAEHGVGLAQQLAHRNWYPNIALVSEFKFGISTENVENRAVCRQINGECVDTNDLFARRSNPFNFNAFTLGIAMQWEFDYWQNRGKSMEADAKALRLHAQKKRALGAIELEVNKLYQDAKEAFLRVEITTRRLDAARRWRDQFGLAASSGGADIADAVDPMKAFFTARGLSLQAHFDYKVALAALNRACGIQGK